MRYAIVSDLHGNLEAYLQFEKTILKQEEFGGIIILGDVIDYGPHSNEVIKALKEINIPILCNIIGNHEQIAITGDKSRLSAQRGRDVADITRQALTKESLEYINFTMNNSPAFEFEIEGFSCLGVHGSLDDTLWGHLEPKDNMSQYIKYDYVFSGHTHVPQYFEYFHKVDDIEHRNKKKTVFINPGSLGQPRNLSAQSQFAIINMPNGEISFIRNDYDIKHEQMAFDKQVDEFYQKRLEKGL